MSQPLPRTKRPVSQPAGAGRVTCPSCGQRVPHLLSYRLPKLVLFVVVGAAWRSAVYTSCASCMRRTIGKLALINIVPANALYLFIGPYYLAQFARTYRTPRSLPAEPSAPPPAFPHVVPLPAAQHMSDNPSAPPRKRGLSLPQEPPGGSGPPAQPPAPSATVPGMPPFPMSNPQASARLEIVAGPGTGAVFSLHPGINSVGRDKDANAIVLDFGDRAIHRRNHAVFRLEGKGLWIEDKGQPNPVFVNGRKLFGSRLIEPGDEVGLGETTLRIDGHWR